MAYAHAHADDNAITHSHTTPADQITGQALNVEKLSRFAEDASDAGGVEEVQPGGVAVDVRDAPGEEPPELEHASSTRQYTV